MFEKMFEKKYKVKKLMAIELFRITEINNHEYSYEILNYPYVIVKKGKHDIFGEYSCKSVFNDAVYNYVSSSSRKGGIYFHDVIELSMIFPTKDTVTKDELLQVYYELNGIENENVVESPREENGNVKKRIRQKNDKVSNN